MRPPCSTQACAARPPSVRLAPVLDAIVEEFEVERDVAANDLLRLVGELRDHGLVVVEPT